MKGSRPRQKVVCSPESTAGEPRGETIPLAGGRQEKGRISEIPLKEMVLEDRSRVEQRRGTAAWNMSAWAVEGRQDAWDWVHGQHFWTAFLFAFSVSSIIKILVLSLQSSLHHKVRPLFSPDKGQTYLTNRH